mmetsp:Transcript_6959/g.29382  ORF Transcript_6959/g.29382 Transcript_6959/m.29382 type:complete len:371 (+) Transcript_6959:2248-3360(+)
MLPVEGEVHLARQAVAVGAAWVAGDHDEVALVQWAGRHLQVVLGREGLVVLAVVGRLAVRADVGAVEAVVAGVARPHPVVGIATEAAHHVGRCVHEAHVADLELLDQLVLQAAEEGVDVAAVALVGLTGGDQLLLGGLDCVGAGLAGQRAGLVVQDLGADVLHVDRHQHAAAGGGGQLVGQRGGVEAVLDQVALGLGIVLDAAVGAVVVGDDQALGRHEAGGAAAQRHDRAHREGGQVLEAGRVEREALGLQRLGDLRQLLGHPHAFGGMGGGGGQGSQGQQREGVTGHAEVHRCSKPVSLTGAPPRRGVRKGRLCSAWSHRARMTGVTTARGSGGRSRALCGVDERASPGRPSGAAHSAAGPGRPTGLR